MEDRIKGVLAAVFGIAPEVIDENASPETIEAWDSLKHMNLVIALEEEFGLEFNDDEILELVSYSQIKRTLQSKS